MMRRFLFLHWLSAYLGLLGILAGLLLLGLGLVEWAEGHPESVLPYCLAGLVVFLGLLGLGNLIRLLLAIEAHLHDAATRSQRIPQSRPYAPPTDHPKQAVPRCAQDKITRRWPAPTRRQ